MGVARRAIHIDAQGRPWVSTNRTLSWWHGRPLDLLPSSAPRLRTLTGDGVRVTDDEDFSFGVRNTFV